MKFPRAMYSLRMSFWVVPRSTSDAHALLLADELVEQQQHRRGRVDRHRRRDLVERDAVEDAAHVVDRVDRDAGAAHLALAQRVVRVAAELGRQVERHRQAGRAVLDQVVEALVGLLRRRVARVLAHRPLAAAVHVRMDAARERVLPRLAEALLEARRDVAVAVELLDLDAGIGELARVVGPDDGRDGRLLVGLGRHRTADYPRLGGARSRARRTGRPTARRARSAPRAASRRGRNARCPTTTARTGPRPAPAAGASARPARPSARTAAGSARRGRRRAPASRRGARAGSSSGGSGAPW